VFRSPCDAAVVTNLIETTVANFAGGSGIDSAAITTTVTGACGGTGSQLSVASSVPFNYAAVGALAGFSPSVNLTARTVMRNE